MPTGDTFSMRLAPHERQQIESLAQSTGQSMKDAIMTAVGEALARTKDAPKLQGRLAGLEDLVGSMEGPPDLSTNTDYLDDYGK